MKLSEIADIQTGPFGSQLHEKDYVAVGTPIVTVEHLGNRIFTEQNLPKVSDQDKKRLCKYVLSEGDVVFSRVGSVDRCSYVDKAHSGWMFSGRCLRVRPKSKICPEFLYYHLSSPQTKTFIRNIAVGATMPSINTRLMSELNIAFLPDLVTQRKIAAVLKSLDDKIELNNKINDNLEQQAQAIFKSWFVDNPINCKQGVLSDIAQITMGQSPNGESYNEDGNGTVFFQGRAEFTNRFPTKRLYTTEPNRMAKTNDILLSVRAPVGDCNIAFEDCCIGRGLAAISAKDNFNSFVLYTVHFLKKQLDVFNGEGTVFGCINSSALNNLQVLIPPKETMDKFERFVAPMDATIRNNYKMNCHLSELRDSLLPKLMSGKIDVSNVKI